MVCQEQDTPGLLGLPGTLAPRARALVLGCRYPTIHSTKAVQLAQSVGSGDQRVVRECCEPLVQASSSLESDIPDREAKQDQHALSDGRHCSKTALYKDLVG
jgi:hypothetical protein